MVKKTEGLNRVRDLIVADISGGIHGTDGTDPVASGTAPISPDATTNASVDVTTGNQTFNAEHVLLPTVGNGNTYKEYALRMNSDAEALVHVVYPDFDKTNSLELHTIITGRIQ